MGIASIIIGIFAILISWIPCLWPIVLIHIAPGLGLGIAELLNIKNQSKGMPHDFQARQKSLALAGIWVNVVALAILVAWQITWRLAWAGPFLSWPW